MKHKPYTLAVSLLFWLSNIGCNCGVSASKEIVIPLPGRINGQPLVLAETAASNVSINQDVVPPLITKVWWSTNLIVTENHPTLPRNKFPGDSYRTPDKSRSEWYLIDLVDGSVANFKDYHSLINKIQILRGSIKGLKLMPLREAQSKREDELGFKFDAKTVDAFLNESDRRGLP